MTRMTWLTVSVFTAAALVGCGGSNGPAGGVDGAVGLAGADGRGTGTGGHGGVAGGADAGVAGTGGAADAGPTGTGGVRVTGTGGAIVAGTGGVRVAGTGGAVDAGPVGTGGAADGGLAGTGGLRVVGTGGAGAGGKNGAGGAPGIGGANGGTGGAAGTDASVLICQDQEICSGEGCQTACDASGKTTFCTCVPGGGNSMQLSCATFSCDRDAGATDARPAFSACPATVMNQPDCDLMTDTVCATTCANRLQTQCVCVPHGGGGNGRWMCGSPVVCE